MRDFLKSMFSDENEQISTKRVAGMLCVLGLVFSLLISTLTHGDIKPSESLVDAVALFAFGALGLTSIDKYTKNRNKK